MLLGTDVLERMFGNMRLKYGHTGFDSLELLYCIRATNKTNEILTKHDDWTKSCDKVMKRLSLAYSKPSSWGVDTLKMRNVSIKSCWDKGRVQTEEFLQNSDCKELEEMDFFALSSSPSISLLKPKGKKIGSFRQRHFR